MTQTLERISHPDDLPRHWDALAGHYYQRRAFLSHCHRYNPCRQRYYVLSTDGHPVAGAVVYSLRLDLFTYLAIQSPVTVQIVGVPCSVSAGGLVGDERLYSALLHDITRQEQGLMLCLNLDRIPILAGTVAGRTLPAITFTNRFCDWEDYRVSLRSAYRRRLARLEADAERLDIRVHPCSAFTDEMHALYTEVYRRSRGKLECVSSDFFRHLPTPFHLITFSSQGRLHGWTIILRDGLGCDFFFGGRSYAKSAPPNLYFIMLLTILRQGIAAGATTMDFGQTAEVPKLRLGGVLREKMMLGYHAHPLLRGALHLGQQALSYTRRVPAVHVFKEGL